MKYSEKFSSKLNNLLNVNYEAEKIYSDLFKGVSNETVKSFFKERQIKRHEFSRVLVNEIAKHNIAPKAVSTLNKHFNKAEMRDIDKNLLGNEDYLLFEVYRLQKESIDAYDDLLMEISLPLSFCKALMKQRDDIQATMRILDRNKVFAK